MNRACKDIVGVAFSCIPYRGPSRTPPEEGVLRNILHWWAKSEEGGMVWPCRMNTRA